MRRATLAALALGLALGACRMPPVTTPSPRMSLESRLALLQDSVRHILERGVRDSAFPGAFALIGTARGPHVEIGVGHLDWAPSPVPDGETMWDMASLTKVVSLTSAVMQLVEQERIALDAPVQRYLPEWTGPEKERVTIRHLLTHSSGLPAWRPLYKEATSPESARALVLATPLDTVPGARYVYSDLGAILLGMVVERVTGERLDQYVRKHVFEPLGMATATYRPPAFLLERIAPTEVDPWRRRHVRGEVHDENAFALGGISGHAGLFAAGRDLERLARAYLAGGALGERRVFRPETIRLFTARQDSALSHRALGWETPNGTNSAGRLMSPHAFGHTGFTGTSFWVDPEAGVYVILLTNRVNPTRERSGIGAVRQAVADASIAVLAPSAAPAPSAPVLSAQ